jgi:hypothetical protein
MMEQRQLLVEVGAIPDHFYEVKIYEFTKVSWISIWAGLCELFPLLH